LPLLLSIQVGLPQTYGDLIDESQLPPTAASPPETPPSPLLPRPAPWTTGFFKAPVDGPVWLGRTNLDGDAQADLVHHGGPDKAVLAYSAGHYPLWRQELGRPDLSYGGFGENLTIAGLTEANVCIGDAWQIGDSAIVEVSQPRQPCWKLSRFHALQSRPTPPAANPEHTPLAPYSSPLLSTLPARVLQTSRTGWYLRVLQEGLIQPRLPLTLLARPHPDWTVQRASRVMHADKSNPAAARSLASLPELAESWRLPLTRRANGPDA
jgi:MOSC domain-containing protein YiiM